MAFVEPYHGYLTMLACSTVTFAEPPPKKKSHRQIIKERRKEIERQGWQQQVERMLCGVRVRKMMRKKP
jgi:hypothetical protein